ncbi:spore germination protein [Paenibacillus sp. y28]|uniref:spore germination protein n=1 Tax=Paenibacillus sp. y28 TaxID=3129110 RepID=UPI0030198589
MSRSRSHIDIPNPPKRIRDLPGYPTGDLTGKLLEDVDIIRRTIQQAPDLIVRELDLTRADGSRIPAAVLYMDGLANAEMIHKSILLPMVESHVGDNPIRDLGRLILTAGSIEEQVQLAEIIYRLLFSSTIVLIDGIPKALLICTEGWEHRTVSEPKTEPIGRGPQDAFNEVLRVNTALLRRRIKDPRLVFDNVRIGRRSLTDISIAYLQDVANPGIVQEIKNRLQHVDIDMLTDGQMLAEFIEDHPISPFPQMAITERVDKTAVAISEGRVALIVDGTPGTVIVPITMTYFLFSTEDYYSKWLPVMLIRWLRVIALCIALLLPSLYVAISSYHQEMLPTGMMLQMAANRSGLPFPSYVEALIMELSFELLREASLRMPGTLGQTIGIVGAIVIGSAAVEAGIVGPILTIIVSFTAIGSFVIPSYNTSFAIRVIRFPLMILSATLGLYGILFGVIALLIHLNHLYSFGVPYMASFTPESMKDWNDSLLVRKPMPFQRERPSFLRVLNRKRKA